MASFVISVASEMEFVYLATAITIPAAILAAKKGDVVIAVTAFLNAVVATVATEILPVNKPTTAALQSTHLLIVPLLQQLCLNAPT